MLHLPRSTLRQVIVAGSVAATLVTADAFAQSLPTAPVPPVQAPAVPTVPDPGGAPSLPSAPSTPQVPAPPAPVPDVDPPTRVLPPAPSAPDSPTVPDAPPVPVPPPGAAPVPATPSNPQPPSLPKAPSAPSPDLPAGVREAPGRSGGAERRQAPSRDRAPASPDGATGARGDTPGGGGSGAASGGRSDAPRAGSLLATRGVGTRARAGGKAVRIALRRSDRFERTPSQRRLRRLLESRGSCLVRLPALRRRIVLLRVGVEGRRPLSRREVARRLDLSIQRVAAEERAAVRRLRATGGSCSAGNGRFEGSAGDSGGLLTGIGAIDAGAAARGVGALLAGDLPASSSAVTGPRNEVAGAQASSSDAELVETTTRRDAATRTLRTPFGTIEPPSRESLLAASLLAVVAALAALLLVREIRRRWRSG